MDNILKRTHDKSYFQYFHYESPYAKNTVFKEGSSVLVLQIMKIDSDHCLVELVNKSHL